MLSKDAFIEFILKGPQSGNAVAAKTEETALPEGFEDFGFDTDEPTASVDEANSSFARRLLEASGFGYAELVQRDSVIRSSDVVARYLPTRAAYWPKTAARPYQTVLFEADLNDKDLKAIPAFRHQKMSHLDIVEDALSRLVEEALSGFQQGGQGVTADVRQGRREETLCVISILDERDGKPVRLVCFGTQNKQTGGLETFRITEQTRLWEPQIAHEHLGLLYERQFKKLTGPHWQEAFTTTEERKQAERLLAVCTGAPTERDIQEGILTLLDTIAKGFGLRRKPGAQRRLQAFDLPPDHDIGIDPEEREARHGGRNPFGGVALRDERNRLLGYIVYPLKTQADAERLRTYLRQNNRFHNVLVVYPGADQAALELWQGQEQLTGKLRKGQGYRDAAEVVNLLSRFFVVSKAKVHNPAELAQELAYRARYLRRLAVKQLEEEPESGHLRDLYNAFKEALVHDQTEDEFADAYAQTLTYGLLSARWVAKEEYVSTGERFTRENALKHMPATSPFLREFFETVLKASFEFKLTWLMDDIAALLDRIDIDMIFNRGALEADWTTDPVIYFYEPFLQAYDPQIRRARGVYYTPQPVVSFIVRSVDELLHTKFNLTDGLADTTTWGAMANCHEDLKIPEGITPEAPFVQILDPAAGTGSFLSEVIDCIYQKMTKKWESEGKDGKEIDQLWSKYVPEHLLPRLHGYEILMAPYAISHLKLGLKLHETGYRFGSENRVRIYLTNALEPAQDFSDRFAFSVPALAHEAEAVNTVKRHQRYNIVIGNPPYSVSTQNDGAWITELCEDFKGGLEGERNIQPLSDDYIKFLRFALFLLEQSGFGFIAMITNREYIQGVIHRTIRKKLQETADRIYLCDLHGQRGELLNTSKLDENVFEIGKGVTIGIFSFHGRGPATVLYGDIVSQASEKLTTLNASSASTFVKDELHPSHPYWFFKPRQTNFEDEYLSMHSIVEFFSERPVTGFATHRDHFAIDIEKENLVQKLNCFLDPGLSDEYVGKELCLHDTRDWKLSRARVSARQDNSILDRIRLCAYRPFDYRWVIYSDDILEYSRRSSMQHIDRKKPGLICSRIVKDELFSHVFISPYPIEKIFLSPKSSNNAQVCLTKLELNAGSSLVDIAREGIMLPRSARVGFAPNQEDLLSYLYALLYSVGYRLRYAEYLSIDFPRVPLTGKLELFQSLGEKGSELVSLHLMESPKLNQYLTTLVGSGDFQVEKVSYDNETVWLDRAQTHGFQGVPKEVWNFHIGGYQVCEKWLKDHQAKGGRNPRPGRILTDEDIAHYQKIVVALNETIRIMAEIDEVIDQHGGWPDAFVTKDGDNA